MEINSHYYAVIVAGGGGTRLWPKSRKKLPKHLLSLFGKNTLLQQTYQRISPIIPNDHIFVVTLADYVPFIKNQLPKILFKNIIVEPMSKNTALAMGTATAFIKHLDNDAVIANLAADHLIKDEKTFQKTILNALDVASKGDYVVAIGIRPTFPHTGLGYIRIGHQSEQFTDSKKNQFIFKCKGFKEKPDLVTAQSFLASGQYLWNAGYYIWSATTLFKDIKLYSPEISQGLEKIFQAFGSTSEQKTLESVYQNAENVQIDVAVSEKAKNLVVIPGEFDWSDVGDWKVIYDTQNKNNDGNVINGNGDHLEIETKNCLIESDGRTIVTIGLNDVMIVDTKDALLVCAKNRTQDVKKAVEQLKLEKKDSCL